MASFLLPRPAPLDAKPKVQQILLPGQTPQGEHILGVLVKRTYDIVPGGVCTRAAADKKLISADAHYEDPMNTTVKSESDFIPFKIATDVVLTGKAYAPSGLPVSSLTTSLAIGPYRKDLLIIGDRVTRYNDNRDPIFTPPQPFETMELRYERAYGGVDIYSEPKFPCPYPRNHLGRGYAVTNNERSLKNLQLPNIEDPANPLTPANLCSGKFDAWQRQPVPQGFGWTLKMWHPRSTYGGVMPADRPLEQELRKAFAALLPADQRKLYEGNPLPDMDFRFFNGASPGLVIPFLAGGEPVELVNLDPSGKLQFQLPRDRPQIGLDIGNGIQKPQVFLHTVAFRMEERQVDLVWRGAVPYAGPDSLPKLKKMDVSVI